MLHASRLVKSYGSGEQKIDILRELNLSMNSAEVVAIMGPSGCGKSTLISCLAGLTSLDSGTITFADHSLHLLNATQWSDLRAKEIGIVFQQFHLIPHLTAYENVRLPLDLNDVTAKDAHQRTIQSLETVGLLERKDHFPNQLSRGECQRVAIARVLVNSPKLILADEPTASLDRKNALFVTRQLVQLSKQAHSALLIVTHDPEVAAMADRRLIFRDGQLSDSP